MDISNALKKVLDKCYSVGAKLGLRPFELYLVTITNTGSRPGVGGSRLRTDQRILIGDGYTVQDGYINPLFLQVTSSDVFFSGGLLTDSDYKLVLVPVYTTLTGSKGIAESIFNTSVNDNNTQLYLRAFGPDFPSTGQYFKRKYSTSTKLTYTSFWSASGEIPGI